MNGRVLFVEDDERVRLAYTFVLEGKGYEVIQAGSVATALMHLDVVDLKVIILDLRLPNGHGRKVIEALVAKRNDVAIVILSGTPDEHAVGWPVTAALQKPAPRAKFLEAVKDAFLQTFEGVERLRENVRRLKNLEIAGG